MIKKIKMILIKLSFNKKIELNCNSSCADRINMVGLEYKILSKEEYENLISIENPKFCIGHNINDEDILIKVKIKIIDDKFKDILYNIKTYDIYDYIITIENQKIENLIEQNFDEILEIVTYNREKDTYRNNYDYRKSKIYIETNDNFQKIQKYFIKQQKINKKISETILNNKNIKILINLFLLIANLYPELITSKHLIDYIYDENHNFTEIIEKIIKINKNNIIEIYKDEYKNEYNLLTYLAECDNIKIITLLYSLNVNINIIFNNGENILFYVNDKETYNYLINKCGVKIIKNNNCNYPDFYYE